MTRTNLIQILTLILFAGLLSCTTTDEKNASNKDNELIENNKKDNENKKIESDNGTNNGDNEGGATDTSEETDTAPLTPEATPTDTGDTDFVVDWGNIDVDAYRATDSNVPTYTIELDGGHDTPGWDASVCPDWDITITLHPSRLMILQDISSSMREGGDPNKWEQAQSALISLLGSHGSSKWLHWGFDVFPDKRDCFADEPLVIDSAPENGKNIFEVLNYIELSQSTPLFMAMGNFLEPSYAPVFSDKTYPSYLIIVSDGKDTCGNQTDHMPDDDYGANAAQLGVRAKTLRTENEIFTIAIGFGDAADPDQLNAIAKNGGTDFDQYIPANNRNELTAIFDRLANYAINCEFAIDVDSDDTGYNIIWEDSDFHINGTYVPNSKGCTDGEGWDWVAPGEVMKFCPDTCNQILNQEQTDVTAELHCVPEIIVQ